MQELRHAVFSFRHNPGFTTAAVLTLALAIGATTAVYSIVYGVLLRPLDLVEPQRLVRLWEEHPGGGTIAGNRWLSHRTYEGWVASARTVSSIGGYINSSGIVRIGDEGVALRGVGLTPSMVQMIGAVPRLGRWFTDSEATPGAARVIVLSHRLWLERFGGRADVIGSVIRLDDQPCTIVGVAPATLRFPDDEVQFWVPYAVPTLAAEPLRTVGFNAVARLAGTASAAHAETEGTAAARVLKRPPSSDVVFGRGGPVVVHARLLAEDIAAPVRPAVLALAVAVALVLLVACANVANLLLSRGVARQREFAIRIALGAGRGRLVRQLLVESALLASAGGVLGVWLAWALVQALPAIAPERFPRLGEVAIDLPVLAIAVVATIAVALASGVVPALRGAGAAAAAAVRGGGDGTVTEGFRTRAAGRIRDGLLALEASFAVVLLVGALLLGHSLARLMTVDAGYTADEVVTATIRLPRDTGPERTAAFLDALADRLRARPDVAAVGAATTMPMVGMTAVTSFPIAPTPQSDSTVLTRSITYVATPGYAEAIGLRLREGRFFTSDDQRPGVRALVVNEEFARRYLRGPVVGRRFERIYSGEGNVPTEIVGVVGNRTQRRQRVRAGARNLFRARRSHAIAGQLLLARRAHHGAIAGIDDGAQRARRLDRSRSRGRARGSSCRSRFRVDGPAAFRHDRRRRVRGTWCDARRRGPLCRALVRREPAAARAERARRARCKPRTPAPPRHQPWPGRDERWRDRRPGRGRGVDALPWSAALPGTAARPAVVCRSAARAHSSRGAGQSAAGDPRVGGRPGERTPRRIERFLLPVALHTSSPPSPATRPGARTGGPPWPD